MLYREVYGKYWNISPRQWRNLGIVFDVGTTGINSVFALEAIECDGPELYYLLLFAQIIIIKEMIIGGNDEICRGIIPEIIYDRITSRSANIQKYLRNANGDIKPSIIKQPYTHLLNCIRKWISQCMYDIKNHVGRYAHRTALMSNLTIQIDEYRLAEWRDAYSYNLYSIDQEEYDKAQEEE